MSETTPETTESTARPHLQPVREDTPAQPAAEAPARQGGGHLTGLLALLLAAALFAFLAQLSANRQLTAENQRLTGALAASEAGLQASREQMSEARNALAGLRDVLVQIEAVLAPPSEAE